MVNIRHVFYQGLKLAGVELDLRVGHVDRLEGIRLLGKRLLLVFEVLNAICQVGSFDLSAFKVVDLGARLNNILLAEAYKAEMLIKVFLLA